LQVDSVARKTVPVFGSRISSDWWPGVCPGVEMNTTVPSPNKSL